MRLHYAACMLLVAALTSACDLWPRDLRSLAESISQQVSGQTTAWLMGGDGVVINVVGSPLYEADQTFLEAQAADIAKQASGFVDTPLEFIVVTFYASELSDDPAQMREFTFLKTEDPSVLQRYPGLDATGPLTFDEVQAAYGQLEDSIPKEHRGCMLKELRDRALTAGDPETLNPTNVEFLSAETWNPLDPMGKRIILTQAISTQAMFFCLGQ